MSRQIILGIIALAAGWGMMLTCSLGAGGAKAPPPAAGDQDVALRQIKRDFVTEYSLTTPTGKRLLVKMLLDEAEKSPAGNASRFVLLKEARETAIAVGDASLCRRAIDLLDQGYVIDATAMRTDAVARLCAQPAGEDAAILEWGREMIKELMQAGQYDAAQKVMAQVWSRATKANDAETTAVLKSAQAALSQYERIRPSFEALKKNPADPAANLAVAKFYWLAGRGMEVVLPLLARGSDEAIKAAATAELASPADASGQFDLAEKWWEALRSNPEIQPEIRARAAI